GRIGARGQAEEAPPAPTDRLPRSRPPVLGVTGGILDAVAGRLDVPAHTLGGVAGAEREREGRGRGGDQQRNGPANLRDRTVGLGVHSSSPWSVWRGVASGPAHP